MLELVAIGTEPGQTWRRALLPDREFRIGRTVRGGWAVPWDRHISREQADLQLCDQTLHVRCLEGARNPAFVGGRSARQFTIQPGQSFRLGKTTFYLESAELSVETSTYFESKSFSLKELSSVDFHHADQRLEVLSQLPAVISSSLSDRELAHRVAQMLLEGIPRAEAAAVQFLPLDPGESSEAPIIIWEVRDTIEDFRPSRRLIRDALERGESTLNMWNQAGSAQYTVTPDLDWAFCTPVRGKASQGWGLYVSGRQPREQATYDFGGDVRFAELLAQTAGSIRDVRLLERQQAGLAKFFSPGVIETLTAVHADGSLQPKECDVDVLFCDLRGFSLAAERSKHDLQGLLGRCSQALGLMTHQIFEFDGVVADFQGDAALGFWGWPISLPDGPLRACRAALAIDAEFRRVDTQPGCDLSDFRVGIGIAHGSAIAGRIGTDEQAKVGVFGPVVNLGSRLESLTKHVGVSMLVDAATAEFVCQHVSPDEARCRLVACVRPAGMETDLAVYQLMHGSGAEETITDEVVRDYESAWRMTAAGNWVAALEKLNALPPQDGPRCFLLDYLQQHDTQPPDDWNGVIQMRSK